MERKSVIIKSLCEDLILHNQILIPTQDYLTACGLILIAGEKGFIELLERDKLKFIRIRGAMGFASGKGPSELCNFYIEKKQHPSVSPIEESADAGLTVIGDRIKDKKKLHELIVKNSFAIESSDILTAVKYESVKDLKYTSLWRAQYESGKPGSIILPKKKEIKVQVLGTNDPGKNIQTALLALATYNSDLYLAEKFECQNTSPFYSVGDILDIKQNRLLKSTGYSDKLWKLIEIDRVPDLSQIDLAQGSNLSVLLNLVSNKNVNDFRDWFHANHELNETELLQEYISVLRQVPWIQSPLSKTLRFAVTSIAGFIPVVGQLASAFDTFIVDRFFCGKSPKFFIDDLTNIKGSLKLKSPPMADGRKSGTWQVKKKQKRRTANASRKRNRK
jgi:hypothetical protein